MAARENQGYLIAIIVLSVLSILLILGTVFGWSKASEYWDNKVAAEANLQLERTLREAHEVKANVLATMIGAGGSVAEIQPQIESLTRLARGVDSGDKSKVDAVATSLGDVKAVYETDMKSNSSAGASDALEPTYKNLIANLNSVLAKKHNELIVKTNENETNRIESDAKIQQAKSEIDALAKTVQETQTRLEDFKAKTSVEITAFKDKMGATQEQASKLSDDFTRFRDVANEEKNKLVSQKTEISRQAENLKTRLNEFEREVFTIPDGKINKVNANLGTVVLNIGRANGLKVNRSFSVYDRSVNNFEKGRHKASIEVTYLVDDNAAEARITEENPLDPILPGDQILSPVWDPGHAVPIALAGFFDLDADGFSDSDKLVQMIKANGGEVVVYHDEQGNISGEIDPSIRYLVLGEPPVEGPNRNPEIVEAMKVLEDQAEINTVQIIDQRKLLNWMGLHGRPKVQTIGGQVSGFAPRAPGGGDGSGTRSDGSGTRSDGSGTRSEGGSSTRSGGSGSR